MQTFLQTQQQTLKAPKRKQFFGKDWLLVPVLTLYFFLFPWLAFSCSSQIRERGPVKNTWLVCNFIDSLSRLGHPRPPRLHSQHFPRIPTQAFAKYCALTRLRTPDLKSPLCPYEIPLWADYSRGTPQNPNSSRSGKQIHKQDWKRLYPDNKIKKKKTIQIVKITILKAGNTKNIAEKTYIRQFHFAGITLASRNPLPTLRYKRNARFINL